MNTPRWTARLARATATLLATGVLLGGSCDRMARKHPITLDAVVFEFHQALQNKRFEEASQHFAPKHREDFLRQWKRAERLASFHELDVTSMTRTDDAEYARVEATLRYLMNDNLTEKTHHLFELWRGEGKGWYLDAVVEAPPEFRDPLGTAGWQPPPAEGG